MDSYRIEFVDVLRSPTIEHRRIPGHIGLSRREAMKNLSWQVKLRVQSKMFGFSISPPRTNKRAPHDFVSEVTLEHPWEPYSLIIRVVEEG